MNRPGRIAAFVASALASTSCYAQTAGTIAAEEKTEGDIVVVAGKAAPTLVTELPDSPKARAVVRQEYISRTVPGQSIFNAVNLVPGVNFVSNDPYGGSGGGVRIRGFDSSRISFTFDGLPLNDAGNYAIYANQQIDPELVESVNVNFGSTDVDSPTASAAGGTVNYRTIVPTDALGAVAVYSHGRGNMNRVFGLIHTGTLTSSGTRAWFSASTQTYDLFRYAAVRQSQYNARIYQPLATGTDDFVSLSGFFRQHRNTTYGTPSLAQINTMLGNPYPTGTAATGRPIRVALSDRQFDRLFDDRSFSYLNNPVCTLSTPGNGTVQDERTLCTNARALGLNPVDTGNARVNSLVTLSDKLTFTFDGGYSYTLANGGGSTVFSESDAAAGQRGVSGNQVNRLGAGIATGADLNRDADLFDYIRVFYPSNTQTHRLIAIGGVRYDIDSDNLVRLAYTWDRARTHQTGGASLLSPDGKPQVYFDPAPDSAFAARDAAGNVLNKRNRISYAVLHQLSGEYRGRPFDDSLQITLGLRASLFRRNLNNTCLTIPGSGSEAYCTSQDARSVAANTRTASFGAPYRGRIKEYKVLLPNVGVTWRMAAPISLFGSYTRGFSAPTTDLYAFDDQRIKLQGDEIKPERTDSYDLGLRYASGIAQAQLAGWFIRYDNRMVTTTTPLQGGGTINSARNVGRVDSKGIDASLTISPTSWLSRAGQELRPDQRREPARQEVFLGPGHRAGSEVRRLFQLR
jgi:iron complex outermembrane receptor protein